MFYYTHFNDKQLFIYFCRENNTFSAINIETKKKYQSKIGRKLKKIRIKKIVI